MIAASPQQEPGAVREVVMNNEGCGTTAILPSGQTLAGAGGDGHVAYQLTEPGVRPCISAVIWNDETGKPGKGTHVWLTAPSAGTTRDAEDAEDAARWRALIGSARVRVLGSAGLHSETDPYGHPWNGYAHIGVELWTKRVPAENEPPDAVEWLTKYADAARRAREVKK